MVDESSPQNSELLTRIQFQVKGAQEITDQDLEDLRQFSDKSINLALEEVEGKTEKWEDSWETAYVNSKALTAVKTAKLNNNPASIVLARDQQGELMGYSMVVINKTPHSALDSLNETFISVRSDVQKQGIGTEILRIRIETLKRLGIKIYQTNARPAAINLYDRLGIHYTAEALPDSREGAKRLTVYLE
ncbi:GNAT family N-acetyltransferase [Candidatus Daviesbacteria bacterium]|nr:GNAT family N-acetyltransferase [Candidatus Daviesbacteria bacterium]